MEKKLTVEKTFDLAVKSYKEILKTQFCYHPFTDFGVLWNGDVTLCCLDHDGTLEAGNVRNNSIEEVLKSSSSRKLRAHMHLFEELHPTFQNCQSQLVKK